MMIVSRTSRTKRSGLSLIVTLVIATGATVLIGGVLYYTSTQTTLARRINQYDSSVSAAVAATEKVVTSMTKDFQVGGDAVVQNNLNAYRGLVPTVDDGRGLISGLLEGVGGLLNLGGTANTASSTPLWSRYEFAGPGGGVNQTHVEMVSDWAFRDLDAKYPGLRGYAATYRIVSNAREKDRAYHIISAVRQDVQVASVPISQFQYFYVPDMELNPLTPGMVFNGRIHCNGNIYAQPTAEVVFQNHVTASRRIVHSKHPADPVSRGNPKVNYRADREIGLNTLNIPIGTNAGPNQLRQILEPPTSSESPTSLLAQERFYNKAELVVVVSNDVVTARSGSYNGGSVTMPWLETRGIVTRNPQGFYDARECRDVEVTDIDLAKLALNYNDLTKALGRPLKTLWILDVGDDGKRKKKDKDDDWGDGDDQDKGKGNDKPPGADGQGAAGLLGGLLGGGTLPPGAVRLINGATLPAAGFSLVTPNPVYVQGTYNANHAPALLAGDAVTILSGSWADINGARLLSSRIAANTTVNAAFVTGIVPTGGGAYSGGVENALRLLEDWEGKTFTFNGSIAVLYYSKQADAPWGGPGVYKPPTRAWSYDANLGQAAKTPPGMPAARTVFRGDWTLIKPNSRL